MVHKKRKMTYLITTKTKAPHFVLNMFYKHNQRESKTCVHGTFKSSYNEDPTPIIFAVLLVSLLYMSSTASTLSIIQCMN